MRNLNLEAAIWYLLTSPEFYEAAANDCNVTKNWFESVSRQFSNFGRNNYIYDTLKKLEGDFRRGATLSRLGDYNLIFQAAESVSGNIRGIMEQPLHSWMTDTEYREFESVRLARMMAYSRLIRLSLHNAIMGASSYFGQNLNYPERRDDDDGLPGDDIVRRYNNNVDYFKQPLFQRLPDPLPEYNIEKSISCHTGDEVPWTGVWYPTTGLEHHSLTFAIKGMRMQAVYKVIKTTEELRTEVKMFPPPETVAIATTWHPVIAAPPKTETITELWSKAGQQCPKEGVWEPTDPGAARRYYRVGDVMLSLGSAHGLTVWRWISER